MSTWLSCERDQRFYHKNINDYTKTIVKHFVAGEGGCILLESNLHLVTRDHCLQVWLTILYIFIHSS